MATLQTDQNPPITWAAVTAITPLKKAPMVVSVLKSFFARADPDGSVECDADVKSGEAS
jgi:hypothetical protein